MKKFRRTFGSYFDRPPYWSECVICGKSDPPKTALITVKKEWQGYCSFCGSGVYRQQRHQEIVSCAGESESSYYQHSLFCSFFCFKYYGNYISKSFISNCLIVPYAFKVETEARLSTVS